MIFIFLFFFKVLIEIKNVLLEKQIFILIIEITSFGLLNLYGLVEDKEISSYIFKYLGCLIEQNS